MRTCKECGADLSEKLSKTTRPARVIFCCDCIHKHMLANNKRIDYSKGNTCVTCGVPITNLGTHCLVHTITGITKETRPFIDTFRLGRKEKHPKASQTYKDHPEVFYNNISQIRYRRKHNIPEDPRYSKILQQEQQEQLTIISESECIDQDYTNV